MPQWQTAPLRCTRWIFLTCAVIVTHIMTERRAHLILFMLQFVKFTSGITVSSLITWITQTAWHIKCRKDLYYLLFHRQGINVFLPAKMNHRCLIKILVEDPHRCLKSKYFLRCPSHNYNSRRFIPRAHIFLLIHNVQCLLHFGPSRI